MLKAWLENRRVRNERYDDEDVMRALAFFGVHGVFVDEGAIAVVARLSEKRTCAALRRLELAYRVECEYRRKGTYPYTHRLYRATATPEQREAG